MNEQLIVVISNTGEVQVEVQGCAGSGCGALTRDIEAALGKTVADRKKPEFYESHVNQNVTSSY